MAGQGAVGLSAGIERGAWGMGMEAAGGAVEVGEQGMIFFVIQIFLDNFYPVLLFSWFRLVEKTQILLALSLRHLWRPL